MAQNEAVGLTDGRVPLDRLIERMRAGRIIIPGISVVERLAATAMHSADLAAIAEIGALEHAVHDDREFPGDGHGRPLKAKPLTQLKSPALETALGSRDVDGRVEHELAGGIILMISRAGVAAGKYSRLRIFM